MRDAEDGEREGELRRTKVELQFGNLSVLPVKGKQLSVDKGYLRLRYPW
jgi:hypothetical protein